MACAKIAGPASILCWIIAGLLMMVVSTPFVILAQTLSRTIMTSGLTLLVVLALFLYGGDNVHGFALALIIGIVIGTYSSIYVAGSLAIAFGLNRQSLLPKTNAHNDEMP